MTSVFLPVESFSARLVETKMPKLTSNPSSSHTFEFTDSGSDRIQCQNKQTQGFQCSKGSEAKLNRAIFQPLALKGLQTIYDILKQVTKTRGLKYTRYASVNRPIRVLEDVGHIKKSVREEQRQVSKPSPTTSLTGRSQPFQSVQLSLRA